MKGFEYIKLNMEIGLCDILLTKVDGKLFSIRFAAGWVQKNFSELSRIKAQKIAYVPGGLYPLSGIVALWRVQKVKTVLPYFLERIIPHSILSRKLQVAGFNSIICQSPLTASDAIKSDGL